MTKRLSWLCILCLLLLIPVLLQLRRILPLDTRPLVAEKYAGWSGVLNLWIYQGWPCGSGSISSWLNPCITAFEKAHPGVYIQPQFVDAGAISSMNDSGILPPDMLLIPPGLLTTPRGLSPIAVPEQLRPSLRHCGQWKGANYAVPVTMGGYLWAWNTGSMDALNDDWRDTGVVLSVPSPQVWQRWDAALLSLCSGRYVPANPHSSLNIPPSLPGELELGLVDAEPSPQVPSAESDQGMKQSRRLPADFQYDTAAWQHFINGESSAMPVTQREIRRLQSLSDQGNGPQWQLFPGDNAFTDQLLALAIADRSDDAEREDLCNDFLAWLLSDDSQATLYRASVFSVTDVLSGYGATDPLALLDNALRNPSLAVPRIFDGQWIPNAESIVRKFISNSEEAPVLWDQFRALLTENTNNS